MNSSEERGWCSLDVREGFLLGLWDTTRRGWQSFKSEIYFKVGNEKRVKFWKDILLVGLNLAYKCFLKILLWEDWEEVIIL